MWLPTSPTGAPSNSWILAEIWLLPRKWGLVRLVTNRGDEYITITQEYKGRRALTQSSSPKVTRGWCLLQTRGHVHAPIHRKVLRQIFPRKVGRLGPPLECPCSCCSSLFQDSQLFVVASLGLLKSCHLERHQALWKLTRRLWLSPARLYALRRRAWAIIRLLKPHIVRHRARDQIVQALSPFFVQYATKSWGGAWERGYFLHTMHVGRAISNLHTCGTSTFMVIAYSMKHPNDVKTPYYTIRVSFKMKEYGRGRYYD